MLGKAVLIAMFISGSPALLAETYKLDPSHSRLEFRIKHLGISTVTGHFKKFEGQGDFDTKTQKIADSSITVTMDPASIDTDEPDRDKDLRSANFFDVEKFKDMSFKSKSISYKNKLPTSISGEMTMHGVTRPVVLEIVDWGGVAVDPWGNEKLAFEAQGKLDRTDFGLKWNKPLSQAAGVLVGNEVKLIIYVEAIKVKK